MSNQNIKRNNLINKKYFLFISTLILIMPIQIYLAVQSGVQHDHLYYQELWKLDSEGKNPYAILNPYGPVIVLLGKLIAFGDLTPKIFMCSNFFMAILALAISIRRTLSVVMEMIIFSLLTFLNPLFFYIVIIYGLNDTLVATFIIYAVIFRQNHKSFFVGLFLGLASLTKIYALFLIPFIIFENQKIDKRILWTSISVFGSGNLLAWIFYGKPFLSGMLNTVTRASSLLSPLDALKIHFTDGKLFNSGNLFSDMIEILIYGLQVINPIVVVLVFMYMFRFAKQSNLRWLESSAVSLLMILTFYKVVHPQFFLVLQVLMICLYFSGVSRERKVFVTLLPVLIFLSFFQIIYSNPSLSISTYKLLYLDGGLLFFPLALLCYVRYRFIFRFV
jgi:hypothetical protein